MSIRNVAIMMLMVILIIPATVHAHTLELLGAETTHEAGGCYHDFGSDSDQDSTNTNHDDVRCCELDTPYVLPSSRSLEIPVIIGILSYNSSYRQLDGYARRIYRPPR